MSERRALISFEVTPRELGRAANGLGYQLVPLTPSALVAAGYEPAPVGTNEQLRAIRSLFERRKDFLGAGFERALGALLASEWPHGKAEIG